LQIYDGECEGRRAAIGFYVPRGKEAAMFVEDKGENNSVSRRERKWDLRATEGLPGRDFFSGEQLMFLIRKKRRRPSPSREQTKGAL